MATRTPTLGEQLHAARFHARIKPGEMADLLGVSTQTIRNWEKDDTQGVRRSDLVIWALVTGDPAIAARAALDELRPTLSRAFERFGCIERYAGRRRPARRSHAA